MSINDKTYENFTKIIIEQPTSQAQQNNPPQRGGNTPTPVNREVPRPRDGAQGAQQPVQPANNQSFNINTNTYIDDEEYGLNIEDLDMDVKNWGRLIGSILCFLKTILLNENVYGASKVMLRKKSDKNKLVKTRLDIIFVMFELIGRVEKTIPETAYEFTSLKINQLMCSITMYA